MANTYVPKYKVRCEKCGWTGKRGRARACPRCNFWYPKKVKRRDGDRENLMSDWTNEDIEACKRAGWYLPAKSQSLPGYYPSEAMRAFKDGLEAGRAARPEEKATLKAIEGRLNGIANAMAASLLATPEMAYWRGVIEECYDLARGAKAPPSPLAPQFKESK